jgi:hypothetical protein
VCVFVFNPEQFERILVLIICLNCVAALQNVRISHPTLESFTFNYIGRKQKIEIDLPNATYCRLSAMDGEPAELVFETASMLQRLGALLTISRHSFWYINNTCILL